MKKTNFAPSTAETWDGVVAFCPNDNICQTHYIIFIIIGSILEKVVRFSMLFLLLLSTIPVAANIGDRFTAISQEGDILRFVVTLDDDNGKECDLGYGSYWGSGYGGAFDSKNYHDTITVPEFVNGFMVTGISQCAFQNTHVKKVLLPRSIRMVKDNAFISSSIEEINLPEGIVSIERSAFAWCNKLEHITLPQSLQKMGEYVFRASGIKEIAIPELIDSIPNSAFWECTQLRTLTLPNSLRHIGTCAFSGLSLFEVNIPDSVITMDDSAFRKTTMNKLSIHSRIDLSNNYYAPFQDATIGEFTLRYDQELNSVPDKYFFYLASSSTINTLVIEEGFEEVGKSACSYTQIENLVLPTSLRHINNYAFNDCGIAHMTLHEGCITIGKEAFYNCGLYDLVLPETLESIGDGAFWYCKMKAIIIPDKVKYIGNYAFKDCSDVDTIHVGASVTHIGNRCFNGSCHRTKHFEIPASVSFIGEDILGCVASYTAIPRVRGIVVRNETPPSANGDSFDYDVFSKVILYVPEGKASIFKEAEGWKNFKHIKEGDAGDYYLSDIRVPNDQGVMVYYNFTTDSTALSIGYNTTEFDAYTGDLEIPEDVTYEGKNYKVIEVGSLAFAKSKGLVSILFPKSIKNVSFHAFENNQSVKHVTFTGNHITIPPFCFADCSNLESVIFPDSIEQLEEYTFRGCTNLKTVRMPLYCAVGRLGTQSFMGCEKLNGIIIPEGIKTIESECFSGCKSLKSVHLPMSLRSIQYRAFEGCEEMDELHIKSLYDYCLIGFGWHGAPLAYAHHLYLNGDKISHLVIPNGINKLKSGAFMGGHFETITISSEYNRPVLESSSLDCIGVTELFLDCAFLPSASIETFNDEMYENTTLVILPNLSYCYNYSPWHDFLHIRVSTDGVNATETGKPEIVKWFTIDGTMFPSMKKGINIVKMSDGSIKKLIVK